MQASRKVDWISGNFFTEEIIEWLREECFTGELLCSALSLPAF